MTITSTTDPRAAVLYAVMGGRFRVRLDDAKAKPGARSGAVVDDHGQRIGDACDYIYGGQGFAIHTAPFAGFVDTNQIDFVT